MEKDGPLDGRKYNENNKDSQKGQVTIKNIIKRLISKLFLRLDQMKVKNAFLQFTRIPTGRFA
jgi:hypothetical protein